MLVIMFLFCEAEDEGRYEVEEFKKQWSINSLISSGTCSTILIISFISSFEIIKVVVWEAEDEGRPEPCIFFFNSCINC